MIFTCINSWRIPQELLATTQGQYSTSTRISWGHFVTEFFSSTRSMFTLKTLPTVTLPSLTMKSTDLWPRWWGWCPWTSSAALRGQLATEDGQVVQGRRVQRPSDLWSLRSWCLGPPDLALVCFTATHFYTFLAVKRVSLKYFSTINVQFS